MPEISRFFGMVIGALALVIEWAVLHHAELMTNWERLQAREPALKIEPLR